ncbi:MAG: MscL family protein [Erysipelotrichaceae bacterium]|nr:MscL family protein [Erysipelotrichaceae bacterium]
MAKLTKEEKAARKAERKKAGKGLWAEFKEFINRGNAFMLAVGVVIGGAFSAIVNAFVSMLMSVTTWGVPGGLKGLVTVLPAANEVQAGFNPSIGLGQAFNKADLQSLAEALAKFNYGDEQVAANPNLIESAKSTIMGVYTLHGTTYTYNMSAIIDWGTLINAVIAFIIIAVVLFIIVKVVNAAAAKKAEAEAKARERYYEKHPEERPVEPEPEAPKPTQEELLSGILAELKKQNAAK